MAIQHASASAKCDLPCARAVRMLGRWAVRLVVGLMLVSVAPLLAVSGGQTGWFSAHADDDDGDDGGGGGGGGGGSPGAGGGEGGGGDGNLMRPGGRRLQNCVFIFCTPQRARRSAARVKVQRSRVAQVRSRPVQERRRVLQAPVRQAQRQEFVAFNVSPDDVRAITQARFVVIADGPLSTSPGRIVRLRAPAGTGTTTALRRLSAAAPGAIAARNDSYRSFLRPASQQGRQLIGRALGPDVSCAANATIAMVDTGVDPAHPALAGANFSTLSMRAMDRQPSTNRHGTAVASMLIGREGGPAPGLSPQTRLVAVDAFHRNAAGQDVTDAFDLVRALDLLANQDASVINLSLAGPDNPVLARIIAALLEKGRVIVAAAGNDGPRAKPLFPAAYAGVIAVTAVDANELPWRRAASGPHVAFAALAVDVSLAGRGGGAEAYTGTSFAAPAVSAMLAAKSLRSDGLSVKDRLVAIAKDRGEPGRDPVFGHGIVRPSDACTGL